MVCTFFGHRDAPNSLRDVLKKEIIKLIKEGYDRFLVGNQGNFDAMVRSVLKELTKKYPDIKYSVILAYMPGVKKDFYFDYSDTVFPDALAGIHPRYAISRRNDWMLKQADTIIVYITRSYGGAAKFAESAYRRGKRIINLA